MKTSRMMSSVEAGECTAAPSELDAAVSCGGFTPPSLPLRRAWISTWRRSLAGDLTGILDLVVEETGKPRQEALVADLLPLLAACRWHERHLARVLRPRKLPGRVPWLPGQRITQQRAPLGRVAIIATWNYPVQLLGVQVLQAIAGGNQVVVKPSEVVPRTQALLLELADQACREVGLDAGTLSWTEATRQAGQHLLQGHRFDHIVFTGSTSVGRTIAEIAAQTLTPSTLELSGSDSAIVLDDADVDLAARSIWNAVVMNAGQTCMAPRRVLVERTIFGRFVAALAPLAASAKPVRLVSETAASAAFEAARQAVEDGGRSASAVLEANQGSWMRPLAIIDAPADGALDAGEHFGPVLAVRAVADLEEAILEHRRQPRRLTLSIFTRSRRRVDALADRGGVSAILVNDCVRQVGHPAAFLGGQGESGWGVSRGEEGLLAMTRPLVVCTASRWLRAPAEAPTGDRLRLLERISRWLYGGRAVPRPTATEASGATGDLGLPSSAPPETRGRGREQWTRSTTQG